MHDKFCIRSYFLDAHVVNCYIVAVYKVGTQGTLKGLLPKQLEDLDCEILLGNTYHLGHRPVSLLQ